MKLKAYNCRRTILVFLFVQIFSLSIFAQEKFIKKESNLPADAPLFLNEGIKPHKEIDAIYTKFSEAYETLKPEMAANLYTGNAAYLQPDADVLTRRNAILENFRSFFDSVKNDDRNITISFQILQRKVEKNIGYDVGIYTLSSFSNDKKIGQSKGKFVVVAVRESDGKWRFQVDGYSGLEPPAQK